MLWTLLVLNLVLKWRLRASRPQLLPWVGSAAVHHYELYLNNPSFHPNRWRERPSKIKRKLREWVLDFCELNGLYG